MYRLSSQGMPPGRHTRPSVAGRSGELGISKSVLKNSTLIDKNPYFKKKTAHFDKKSLYSKKKTAHSDKKNAYSKKKTAYFDKKTPYSEKKEHTLTKKVYT